MRRAREWAPYLDGSTPLPEIEVSQTSSGEATLQIRGVQVHSRYRPSDEAVRLIDGASLDPARPVFVVGLGLGYHVRELLRRGFSVAVVECAAFVAKLALESLPRDLDFELAVGDSASFIDTPAFRSFMRKRPQMLVLPAYQRLYPGYVEEVCIAAAAAMIEGERLGVAVVGPMYGGSLPIAQYLARAFRTLGHRTLFVDNSAAWPLYDAATTSVKSRAARAQLGNMLANVVGEWAYARVREFDPNICVVLAQAPVNSKWPQRLARHDIVTAYWFVENWRHMSYWNEIAPRYDYFFHIQSGEFESKLAEIGCRAHAYVPTGCDPELHRPVDLSPAEQEEYGCDLSFAGAGYRNRNELFSGLTDYRLKIWGVEWTARELLPHVQRSGERFAADTFARIVAASKINLNLHASATHSGVDPRCDAVNPRVFEIAACGGFQLCDPCQGLDRLFEFESELPVYRDLAELRRKIDYFLEHDDERFAIAQRARERALREHTYPQRAQRMIDCILDRYASRIAAKGIRAQRTVAEMVERVGRETPLGVYLASLPPDTLFTQDAINAQFPTMGKALGEVEGVFAYLREMRESNEQLLALFDGN